MIIRVHLKVSLPLEGREERREGGVRAEERKAGREGGQEEGRKERKGKEGGYWAQLRVRTAT